MEMEMKIYKHHLLCLVFIVFGVAIGSSCYRSTPAKATFKYVPKSMQHGSLSGPFSGVVVDAGTEKPISKAVVYACWGYSDGVGVNSPSGYREMLVLTDENGRFNIPDVDRLENGNLEEQEVQGTVLMIPGKHGSGPGKGRLTSFRLIVYKRNYIAYRSDRVFPTGEPRLNFSQHNNKILLEQWSPEMSRSQHVRFIGAIDRLKNFAIWEIQAAKAEMEGSVIKKADGDKESSLSLLNVSELFESEDISQILKGDEDLYEILKLDSVPRTQTSDSKHFRAIDKPESYDFAYRVWKVSSERLELRYRRLLSTYPQTRPVDQVGDRSFEAQSKGILAHVFMDIESEVLVAVTCGENLCKSKEDLLRATKAIHSRLNRMKTTDDKKDASTILDDIEEDDPLKGTKKPSFLPRLKK